MTSTFVSPSPDLFNLTVEDESFSQEEELHEEPSNQVKQLLRTRQKVEGLTCKIRDFESQSRHMKGQIDRLQDEKSKSFKDTIRLCQTVKKLKAAVVKLKEKNNTLRADKQALVDKYSNSQQFSEESRIRDVVEEERHRKELNAVRSVLESRDQEYDNILYRNVQMTKELRKANDELKAARVDEHKLQQLMKEQERLYKEQALSEARLSEANSELLRFQDLLASYDCLESEVKRLRSQVAKIPGLNTYSKRLLSLRDTAVRKFFREKKQCRKYAAFLIWFINVKRLSQNSLQNYTINLWRWRLLLKRAVFHRRLNQRDEIIEYFRGIVDSQFSALDRKRQPSHFSLNLCLISKDIFPTEQVTPSVAVSSVSPVKRIKPSKPLLLQSWLNVYKILPNAQRDNSTQYKGTNLAYTSPALYSSYNLNKELQQPLHHLKSSGQTIRNEIDCAGGYKLPLGRHPKHLIPHDQRPNYIPEYQPQQQGNIRKVDHTVVGDPQQTYSLPQRERKIRPVQNVRHNKGIYENVFSNEECKLDSNEYNMGDTSRNAPVYYTNARMAENFQPYRNTQHSSKMLHNPAALPLAAHKKPNVPSFRIPEPPYVNTSRTQGWDESKTCATLSLSLPNIELSLTPQTMNDGRQVLVATAPNLKERGHHSIWKSSNICHEQIAPSETSTLDQHSFSDLASWETHSNNGRRTNCSPITSGITLDYPQYTDPSMIEVYTYVNPRKPTIFMPRIHASAESPTQLSVHRNQLEQKTLEVSIPEEVVEDFIQVGASENAFNSPQAALCTPTRFEPLAKFDVKEYSAMTPSSKYQKGVTLLRSLQVLREEQMQELKKRLTSIEGVDLDSLGLSGLNACPEHIITSHKLASASNKAASESEIRLS